MVHGAHWRVPEKNRNLRVVIALTSQALPRA
jgi:hypothetical protein